MENETQLLPAVKEVIEALGVKEGPPAACEPSLSMKAGFKILAELSESLAQDMKSRDFWDGGDDIDYVNAVGELIQKFTYAVAFEYETNDLTKMLNHLANLPPDDSEEYYGLSDELVATIDTASSGGFESPTLNLICSCSYNEGECHQIPHTP